MAITSDGFRLRCFGPAIDEATARRPALRSYCWLYRSAYGLLTGVTVGLYPRTSNSNNTNNNHNHNFSSGLLLVKVPESASSTAAGIVMRIQERHDCRVEWKHWTAVNYADRNRSTSFLVGPIRQPHSLALSNMFFHDISFHGKPRSTKPPSDKHVRKGLSNKAQFNFLLGYTTTDNNYTSSTLTT